MNDTIPKGTRNSRSILGGLDIPDDPAEAIALLKSAGWPIDMGQLNPLGCLQIGTGYTKGEVLPSDLQSALSLPDNATPAQALEKLRQMVVVKSQIATGSYVGSGGYGAGSPNQLTFPFEPKAIFMFDSQSAPILQSDAKGVNSPQFSVTNQLTTAFQDRVLFHIQPSTSDYTCRAMARKSSDGKTIYWYMEIRYSGGSRGNTSIIQMNEANKTYHYIAIG